MPEPTRIFLTCFDLAQRFLGTKEVGGTIDNPGIVAMLRLDQSWPGSDEVPWCSAFANYIAWLLRLPRSKSLSARSWLAIGTPVQLSEAIVGNDVVILQRGAFPQPPAEQLNAPGHVGFFAGYDPGSATFSLLGGNQGNAVSVARFPINAILGIRRLV